jgi:integrase
MTIHRFRNRWRAEIYVNGKRVASRADFERRADAKEWHDEQEKLWKAGEGIDRKATFADLCQQFEAHLETKRHGTRVRYETEVRRLRARLGFYRLGEITPLVLEGLKAELAAELGAGSAQYCLDVLRTMLNRGVKWRMLRESPYSLDRLEVPKGAYAWWDDEADIKRFLDTARERTKFYPVYLLALETGMRFGELVGLWKEDVDLARGRIHVCRQWLEPLGDFGPPKHGRSRYLDFDPQGELARVLTSAIRASEHPHLVFPSRTGRPLSRSVLAEKVFKSIQDRAKVPPLTIHGLRHSFASWWMIRHDDVWTLSALLGHADVKTTMRYAHHSASRRRESLGLAELVTHKSRTGIGLVGSN